MAKKNVIDKMKAWVRRPGAFETPKPGGPAMPVGFNVPMSLEEQISRVVRSQISKQTIKARAQELDPEFDDLDYEARPESPHEMVMDDELGLEMTRWEKAAVDKERAAFDAKARAYLERRKARQRAAKNISDVKKDVKKSADTPPVED